MVPCGGYQKTSHIFFGRGMDITYEEASQPFEYGKGNNFVIAIHGYPEIPYDMIPLGRYLAQHGFHVYGIKLPGFGGTNEELANNADRKKWQAEVDRVIEVIKKEEPKNIFITGISFGAVMTLYTAVKHPDITALAPICARVLLPSISAPLFKIFKIFKKYIKLDGEPDVQDPKAKKDPIFEQLAKNYDYKGNTDAIYEELIYILETKKVLSQIKQPILICQARKDSIVEPETPDFIFSQVGSEIKEITWYENSGHYIPLDYDSEQLNQDVAEFFSRFVSS